MFFNIAVNKSVLFSLFFSPFIFQNFTSDIGKILELQDVENGLDDYRSTSYLSFEQYRYYLFKEVFSALPDEMSVQDILKVSAVNSLKIKLKNPLYISKRMMADNRYKPDNKSYNFCHLYSDFRKIFDL